MGGIIIGWPWSVGAGAVSATAHLAQWQEAENSSIEFYSSLQTRRADLREALGLPPEAQPPATAGPSP
jgi:phospholipid-binding lipoprotein MlaA